MERYIQVVTLSAGITLGLIGTTITLIGLAIAYYFGSDNKKTDEEEKQKKRWQKIFPGWH